MLNTFRILATSAFGGIITLIVSVNIRKLASEKGWDNFLIHGWDKLPQKWRDKFNWEHLQRFWWLWFIFGASGGVAVALWLTPIHPKSTFLALDDGQKWRFSESLKQAVIYRGSEDPPINCEFRFGSPTSNRFLIGVWTELHEMLVVASWKQGAPRPGYGGATHYMGPPPPGFTILAGDKGPAVTCASALGRVLQDALPTAPVVVRTNQVTEILINCENNCVELDIGDFHSR